MDKRIITQSHLGASMYAPTTLCSDKLRDIADGIKYPNLRSVIFCTEDAVREDQLATALRNTKHALKKMSADRSNGPLRFIRARTHVVLGKLLQMPGIEKIDGFVFPKITRANLPYYMAAFADSDRFLIMPTLETKEVFDAKEMAELRRAMEKDERIKNRLLCLRIGGNDLLNCLGVRRNPKRTIYETPVGELIRRLAGEFIPNGFGLTAPVCEVFGEDTSVLDEECELDLDQGLFGKTAIHPEQIDVIEKHFRVDVNDLKQAEAILDKDAPAVFKMGGRMCEPTTHTTWAANLVSRANIYGTRGLVD